MHPYEPERASLTCGKEVTEEVKICHESIVPFFYLQLLRIQWMHPENRMQRMPRSCGPKPRGIEVKLATCSQLKSFWLSSYVSPKRRTLDNLTSRSLGHGNRFWAWSEADGNGINGSIAQAMLAVLHEFLSASTQLPFWWFGLVVWRYSHLPSTRGFNLKPPIQTTN